MQTRPHLRSDLARELHFVTKHDVTPADHQWFMIDAHWLKKWSHYVKMHGEHPGPISNDHLLDPEHEFKRVKESLKVAVHYKSVCAEVWHYLWHIYGGGPWITWHGDVKLHDVDLATISEAAPDEPQPQQQPPHHYQGRPDGGASAALPPAKVPHPETQTEKSGMLSKLMRSLAMCGSSKKKPSQSKSQLPAVGPLAPVSAPAVVEGQAVTKPATSQVPGSRSMTAQESTSTTLPDLDGDGGDDDSDCSDDGRAEEVEADDGYYASAAHKALQKRTRGNVVI
mmetsp:Transcript_22528/g.52435  ORF Transcript_22528/g.52435 Transcript_22528/m.52435 type:complete len:282 (+) Transcript_22528:86-931(+)|eukprot:CAMPEP_0178389208 /NCGR_PEP_ID=MMETSP0689_2-20121128/9993_1 /TAXON_ID=160604 /ORGANISM="Amphidinium massartii, Strain CS-259" /LENGTH=281 /DNA_ID=CAMNT_0020009641 /DNA_START=55 /DNA_END=900 /DNA_ORIENTATION=-